MADTVKTRRIRETDLDDVSANLKDDLQERKQSTWRKRHETQWGEVDRQIAMEPMIRASRDPDSEEKPQDWMSAIELGELSVASEMYSADARRILFPINRAWFDPKVRGPVQLDPNSGQPQQVLDPNSQKMLNGTLRNMMAQQHIDFGLKTRVDLSLKEAFHHGGFIATVEEDSFENFFDDGAVKTRTAPVWKAHSMWNCYPDEAPSAVAENMYYQGSLFITSFMPWAKFKKLSGTAPGYWGKQLNKVQPDKNTVGRDGRTKDVRIDTYYGDIYIKRGDGDIFWPNMICRLYNDVLCYAVAAPTPWRPVIYACYERMDVRDPYGTSPIIKMSPMQKLASTLGNRFVDGINMNVEPPLGYDANDPAMVKTGGPTIAPGVKIPSNNPNNLKVLEVGDPQAALAGLQMFLQRIQIGTSTSPYKQGVAAGDRLTAEEAANIEQGAEVRPLNFIEKVCDTLRSFLYMQHAMNLRRKDFEYDFYNSEVSAPDWQRVVRKDLPEKAHFEVVGARGVLGEAERAARFTQATMVLSGNPLTAGMLEPSAIAIQMYEDAGMKHPEQFLKQGDGIPPQVKMMLAQMQQAMQELQQALAEEKSGNYVEILKSVNNYQSKMAGIMSKERIADAQIASTEKQTGAQIIAASHDAAKDRLVDYAKNERTLQVQRMADGSYEGTASGPNGTTKKVRVRKTDSGYEGTSQTLQ